jgi:branched-chain amino acid aminotransferase
VLLREQIFFLHTKVHPRPLPYTATRIATSEHPSYPPYYWYQQAPQSVDSFALAPHRNLAFKYGQGLFETIRWTRSHGFYLLPHHQHRLRRGLEKAFGFAPEQSSLVAQQLLEMDLLAALAPLPLGCTSATLRLTVWLETDSQNSAPYGMGASNTHDHHIYVYPNAPDPWGQHPPMHIGLVPGYHPVIGALAGLKTTNALVYARAAQLAHSHGWADALLLNTRQAPAETARFNLLIYQNERWTTPPAAHGLVAGVVRAALLDAAYIQEQAIPLADLAAATAVCLCNARWGIVPVASIALPAGIFQFTDMAPAKQLTAQLDGFLATQLPN